MLQLRKLIWIRFLSAEMCTVWWWEMMELYTTTTRRKTGCQPTACHRRETWWWVFLRSCLPLYIIKLELLLLYAFCQGVCGLNSRARDISNEVVHFPKRAPGEDTAVLPNCLLPTAVAGEGYQCSPYFHSGELMTDWLLTTFPASLTSQKSWHTF